MAKELANLTIDDIVSLSEMEIDLVHGAGGISALEFSARSMVREYAH